MYMWKVGGKREQVEGGWKGLPGLVEAPSILPNPHLNLFLPVFTAAFGLFTAQRHVLKMVYLTKKHEGQGQAWRIRQIVGSPP